MNKLDIDVKETSKIIRLTLRAAFPDVKWSVRLERYSMGHSIDIHWTDGPAECQITPILDRFNGQGFDGMTDCSYYCGKRMYRGELVDFHSGYIRGSRRNTPEFMRVVAARVAHETGTQAPEINEHGYIMAGHNDRVPFQWHACWNQDEQGNQKPLTMADLLATRPLLARDSHEGEWLNNLIDRVAHNVTLKPRACAVELPEYLPETEVIA